MRISAFHIWLYLFTVGFNCSAQKLNLNGIVTLHLTYSNPSKPLPLSIDILHSFPAYSSTHLFDTLSIRKTRITFHCPIYTSQEGSIQVNKQKINLFFIPSDTIYLNFDISKDKISYQVEGKNREVQKYYQAKTAQFPISIGQQMINKVGLADKLYTFKNIADSLYSLENAFFKEHSKNLPPWFRRYESDAIRYSNAYLRLYALSYRRLVNQLDEGIPSNYFDFMKDAPVRNTNAQYDYYYLAFLREYVNYKTHKFEQGKFMKNYQSTAQQKNIELLGKEIGTFFTIFVISENLSDKPKIVNQELDAISIPAEYKYLTVYLKEQAKERNNLLTRGTTSPNFYLPDELDSLITLRQFKGQIVFLSFWFVGCKGCIMEFPFENKLVEYFKDKPVKIISICTRSPREKWLKMVKQYNLKTVNVFANQSWTNKLEETFGINVYPHYVMIGPDGHILENFTTRPSDGADERIREELKGLNVLKPK